MEYFQKTLKTEEEHGKRENLSVILNSIDMVHQACDDYDLAVEYEYYERTLILTRDDILTPANFPVCHSTYLNKATAEIDDYNLENQEKRLIMAALEKTEGNQTKAAELPGISRHTLIRRLERYDV